MLDASVAVGVCLLLAFGPLALGATEEWAIFILQEVAALLLMVWIIRSIAAGRVEFTPNPLFLPMLLFAGLVGLQLLLHRSAYWYATWQKAMLWAAYGILFFLATQVFRRRAWLERLAIAFTIFGFLMAMFAMAQKFAGNGKIYWVMTNQASADFFGPYANHAHYAGLMEMLVPFPLVLAMVAFTPLPLRIIYSLAALVMSTSVFLSKSRGGVIAFLIELVVLAILSAQSRRKRQWGLLAGFCVLLALLMVQVRPHGLWERFAQLGEETDKAHDISRLTMLEDSLQMVRERPLLGWGFGTFPVVYPSFRSFYTDLTVNAAHDDYLEVTVDTGLLGLGLAIAFIFLLYRNGLRGIKHWRHDPRGSTTLAALVGCTGLLVHSFSDFNLEVPANAALFFVLAAIASGAMSEAAGSRPKVGEEVELNAREAARAQVRMS